MLHSVSVFLSHFNGFCLLFANEFALALWDCDGGKLYCVKSHNLLLAGCLFDLLSQRILF